jgi:hypothetical protein
MITFTQWLEQNTLGTEEVDSSQIERLYDKSKISVELVQKYDQTLPQEEKLLLRINTILPLSSGVYGLYMSSENKSVIGPDVLNKLKLIFPQDMLLSQKLQKLPISVVKQYIPDVDEKKITPSDSIHVNIQKILQTVKNDPKLAIIEIGATIVHEATHDKEFRKTGKTNEIGPEKAEKDFANWAEHNWESLKKQIPAMANL